MLALLRLVLFHSGIPWVRAVPIHIEWVISWPTDLAGHAPTVSHHYVVHSDSLSLEFNIQVVDVSNVSIPTISGLLPISIRTIGNK
jgi:hypothetical protein